MGWTQITESMGKAVVDGTEIDSTLKMSLALQQYPIDPINTFSLFTEINQCIIRMLKVTV